MSMRIKYFLLFTVLVVRDASVVYGQQDEACLTTNQVRFRGECIDIDDLTYENFVSSFQPRFSEARSGVGALARLAALRRSASFVAQHNSTSYTLALNAFSADEPQDEQERLGYLPFNDTLQYVTDSGALVVDFTSERDGNDPLPPRVDWVQARAVTSVKDQGRCGCCWAISVCGAIEGAAAITSNFTYLQSTSFQQLISCNDINSGCNGGNTALATVYSNINRFGGLATLNKYSYSDDDGDTTTECKLSGQDVAVDSQGIAVITSISALDTFQQRLVNMKRAVARQPVSVAMRSSCRTFSNYRSGILDEDKDCTCNSPGCVDHAVLLVGYDDDADTPYWRLKNSWGTSWGEDGYFRVAQQNPQPDNPLSWGLFAILSEGIVPVQAFNLTEEVFDEPQTVDDLKWWAVLLIAMAAGLAVGAVAALVTRMVRRRRNSD